MTYELIFTIISSVFSAVVLIFTQRLFERKKTVAEDKEIKEEVEKVFISFQDDKNDVLNLMIKNVAELREYYVMNKQQARNSFSAALFISMLGFFLFASGIVITYVSPEKGSVIPYSTVSGVIVETIAGLFFWLYSKAIKQINIFHTSLQSTEKFLTAIQLVDKISSEQKDEVYKDIISKIISFNFTVAKDKANEM